jgi:hypothetical protein
MYLEAPKVRGAADDFAYWLRNEDETRRPHRRRTRLAEKWLARNFMTE